MRKDWQRLKITDNLLFCGWGTLFVLFVSLPDGDWMSGFLCFLFFLHKSVVLSPSGNSKLPLEFVKLVIIWGFTSSVLSLTGWVERFSLPRKADVGDPICCSVLPSEGFKKGNYLFRFGDMRLCRHFVTEVELSEFVDSFRGCSFVQNGKCLHEFIPEVTIEVSGRLVGGSASGSKDPNSDGSIADRYVIRVTEKRNASVPNSQTGAGKNVRPSPPSPRAKVVRETRVSVLPFPVAPPQL
jgi:hypothetical protein